MGLVDRLRAKAKGNAADARAEQEEEALRRIETGNRLEDAGQLAEALQHYEAALAVAPDLLRGHLNRGNALLAMGNIEGALAAYAGALQRDPDHAPAHYNIGNAYLRADRLDATETAYRKAVACDPAFAAAEVALGSVQWRRGRLDEAVASFRRALALDPQLGDAWNDLALVLRQQGHLEEARTGFMRALAITPDFPEARTHLGIVQSELGQINDAIESQLSVIHRHPDFAEAHSNLGNVYRRIGQGDKAMASYRRAAELKPDAVEGHHNLATALQEAGQLADAARSFRRAIAINPSFAEAHTGLLFCLSHDEAIGPAALYAAHAAFGVKQEAPLRDRWPAHANNRDPGRALRIGFVSADLRSHPVANFIEPILWQLAASRQLVLHAYSNHAVEDEVSRRLRGRFAQWRAIAHISDERLVQQIVDDQIDILFDLSGHTGGHRLLAFARKPAPVQVSWIGYPGTTGLAAMDYYLADPKFLPLAEFSSQFTEKLVHLPASAPFLTGMVPPAVNALPALNNGYVTFGSFNRPSKLSPRVIALWSRLLHAFPGAKILLGAMPNDGSSGALIDWFEGESVDRTRLEFHPRCETMPYLALHHRVDLCLDTFPYSGGTTTAYALLMGVPTLTLAGHTPAGRQGAAFLGQVGLDAFVATSPEDFVERGVRLAGDYGTLEALRQGLRARCEASPTWHPELIAAGLEHAMRIMWQRWCAGLPAAPIDVSSAR